MMHFITNFMNLYGYAVLFFGLMFETLALPLPGEAIMTYAGLLVFQGKMNWILSILIADVGSSLGMTLAYGVGYRLGSPFFEKYGARFHFGPDKFKKTSQWFERYGNKVLIIAYFIPGIRHITGYFSGVTRMPFRTYMIYAYSGALLWTGTFITLGKVLGPKWEVFHVLIMRYLIIAGVIALIIFIVIYLYKKKRTQLFEWTIQALQRFHSLGRVKLLIVVAAIVFIGFFGLMIGLIQDFFAQESTQFDTVTAYIIQAVFSEDWSEWMDKMEWISSVQVLYSIAVLTLLWILFKGKERRLESGFLLFVIIGGELLDNVLRKVFHRVGPIPNHLKLPYTFPSEQTLITLTVYGFSAYLLFRHYGTVWARIVAPVTVVVIALLVGISRIYFDLQYPSDVVAGYVFGGVWLSLNIILLEIFRFMQKEKMVK
jgi:membrane protein DedA with SNARE-associated domain/membrane-associated phospholipid phosphatase